MKEIYLLNCEKGVTTGGKHVNWDIKSPLFGPQSRRLEFMRGHNSTFVDAHISDSIGSAPVDLFQSHVHDNQTTGDYIMPRYLPAWEFAV